MTWKIVTERNNQIKRELYNSVVQGHIFDVFLGVLGDLGFGNFFLNGQSTELEQPLNDVPAFNAAPKCFADIAIHSGLDGDVVNLPLTLFRKKREAECCFGSHRGVI